MNKAGDEGRGSEHMNGILLDKPLGNPLSIFRGTCDWEHTQQQRPYLPTHRRIHAPVMHSSQQQAGVSDRTRAILECPESVRQQQ